MVQKSDLQSQSRSPLPYRVPWDLLLSDMYKENITIAGDTMHPMTPDLAQGGCSSLEDALVLGRHIGSSYLRNGKISTEALKGYIKERRLRVVGLIFASNFAGWIADRELRSSFFNCSIIRSISCNMSELTQQQQQRRRRYRSHIDNMTTEQRIAHREYDRLRMRQRRLNMSDEQRSVSRELDTTDPPTAAIVPPTVPVIDCPLSSNITRTVEQTEPARDTSTLTTDDTIEDPFLTVMQQHLQSEVSRLTGHSIGASLDINTNTLQVTLASSSGAHMELNVEDDLNVTHDSHDETCSDNEPHNSLINSTIDSPSTFSHGTQGTSTNLSFQDNVTDHDPLNIAMPQTESPDALLNGVIDSLTTLNWHGQGMEINFWSTNLVHPHGQTGRKVARVKSGNHFLVFVRNLKHVRDMLTKFWLKRGVYDVGHVVFGSWVLSSLNDVRPGDSFGKKLGVFYVFDNYATAGPKTVVSVSGNSSCSNVLSPRAVGEKIVACMRTSGSLGGSSNAGNNVMMHYVSKRLVSDNDRERLLRQKGSFFDLEEVTVAVRPPNLSLKRKVGVGDVATSVGTVGTGDGKVAMDDFVFFFELLAGYQKLKRLASVGDSYKRNLDVVHAELERTNEELVNVCFVLKLEKDDYDALKKKFDDLVAEKVGLASENSDLGKYEDLKLQCVHDASGASVKLIPRGGSGADLMEDVLAMLCGDRHAILSDSIDGIMDVGGRCLMSLLRIGFLSKTLLMGAMILEV
ncbi:hypothetical protein IFM89_022314 [Coptis chinensis]|uniref:FAD-binding domain-containing protein n=1 Tax=Coptis chinensis TaxID=261450 RepID=A0A835LW27_9MAGN|nr:hypothetical protein IFM89_022314 [Coptis chinensis]